MPCKRSFYSNNKLPGWKRFDSEVCEILDRRSENLELSINVIADSPAVVVSVCDLDGHLSAWTKRYSLHDQQSILDDISNEFGV
ncbi:MAG: hypothetical protein ABSE93_23520 [Terriglobia bacterium]|jgi:hypothetical protein